MIQVQGVTKTYESAATAFPALRGVDLDVSGGDFVAVIGKSGSGKSTSLNLIAGIDNPSSGSVTVAGTRLRDLPRQRIDAWRGRAVGIVFQFFQLLPTLTAAENVMLPMDFCQTFPPRHRRGRALELLQSVGMADQADKLPSGLSGGQQQRVAIARALANDPPVVLADEPTGNLDTLTGTAILKLLGELTSAGKTVVIVTHERHLPGVMHRTVELEDGLLVSDTKLKHTPS